MFEKTAFDAIDRILGEAGWGSGGSKPGTPQPESVMLACCAMSAPIVDLEARTVNHAGTTFILRPLADDSFTILVAGVPVGRAVYTFGAANAVAEGTTVSEEVLAAVAEAWFAALDG